MSKTKQGNLLNYFNLQTSPSKPPTSPVSTPKSKIARTADRGIPNGLSLIPEFTTPAEELFLLNFFDTQPWRTDLARRTMHFGGTYCCMPAKGSDPPIKPEIKQAPPIPPEFDNLMQKFIAAGIYEPDALPEYCIVNEYKSSQGISAHVESVTFDEPVCSLTLSSGCYMKFHELEHDHDGSVRSGKSRLVKRTGRGYETWLEGRSLLVLRGEARRRWQHEIGRNRKGRDGKDGEEWRRISLTFRVKKKTG